MLGIQQSHYSVKRRGGRIVIREPAQAGTAEVALTQTRGTMPHRMIPGAGAAAVQAASCEFSSPIACATATTVFDIFGSDLPDVLFEGVFDHDRRCEEQRSGDL